MITEDLRGLMQRDVRALRREIESYPDDASVWALPDGIKNSAGTLALHLAGNLQNYLGARFGGTGYVRNREAEFTRRDVSREELLRGLDAASAAIDAGFARVTAEDLESTFPEPVGGVTCKTREFLIHTAIHLGYHLGQVDYHRRIVTGESKTVDIVSVQELPSLVKST